MKKLFEKYREIIVYIIVGVMTTVVAYGVRLAVLYAGAAAFEIDMNAAAGSSLPELIKTMTSPDGNADIRNAALLRVVAVTLGWIAGVVFAFFPNKKWVFRDNETDKKAVFRQFLGFTGSRVGTYFVELLIGVAFPLLLAALGYTGFKFILEFTPDLVTSLFSMVVVTVLNYILSKLLVFSGKKKTKQ
ncbi:MAG: GtrA family protein, partial [Clostridia bacterium]|nr:GtrA family protein [Clostridia bacterium]